MTSVLASSRSHHQGETAQLLLIVSDGRGLFMEGMEAVKRAVRNATAARVFTAFVIIDNPENKVREKDRDEKITKLTFWIG